MPPEPDQRFVRYLLGQLDEADRDRFEEEYFASEAVYAELRQVEDRLIETYLRGELPEPVRRRFEASYLTSPSRRARVEAIRTRLESEMPIPFWRSLWAVARAQPWQLQTSVAMLLLAIGVGLPLAVARGIALQGRLKDARVQLARARTHPPLPAPAVEFRLEPGALRAGDPRQARRDIPPGTRLVRLELALPEGAASPSYRVTLRTPEGAEALRETVAPSGGSSLLVTVPADILTGSDYIVALEAASAPGRFRPIASYSLHLAR